MNKLTAQEVIDLLGLEPHPEEGGFFLETHRSPESIAQEALPDRYPADRSHYTTIYYLLTPDTYSHMHKLISDEVFHFYMGDPCEMVQLHPGGSGELVQLGHDLVSGQRPQVKVPKDSWQGMRLLPGGTFALLGCSVAPGFEYADYSHGVRAELEARYPDFAEAIHRLTTD